MGKAKPYVEDHRHVFSAKWYLQAAIMPTTPEEYSSSWVVGQWEFFAEHLFMGSQMGCFMPTPFQEFIMRLYLLERRPTYCDECGLIVGIWCCGKSFLFFLSSFLFPYSSFL
jgi:hypothetical protein